MSDGSQAPIQTPDGSGQPAAQSPRLPRRRFRLVTAIVTTLLCLVGVEVGFRVYTLKTGAAWLLADRPDDETLWKSRWLAEHPDGKANAFTGADEYHPQLGWKPRPNLIDARFGGQPPISTNSRGWRGRREFAFDKPAGTRRMVLVGDSFTFGEGEEDGHIFPALLAQVLPKCDVINLGVHGYGTDQQLLVLQNEGVRYHPDIVVVGLFTENTLRNTLSFRDYAKPKFVLNGDSLVLTNVPVPTPEQILKQPGQTLPASLAWLWARNRLARLSSSRAAGLPDEDAYRITHALLKEISETCRRCNSKMLVVIIPNPRRPDPQTEDRVGRWASEIGYAALNLGPNLRGVEKKEKRPAYYVHFSRLGHVVAASTILDKLIELGWVRTDEVADRSLIDRRYQRALDARPLDAESAYANAIFLAKQNKIDDAIAEFQKALAGGAAKKVEIHTNLGTLLRLKGRLPEAAEHYRKVIELDPANPAGPVNLGDVLAAMGQFQEAAPQFRKALELRPQSAPIWAKLGGATARAGQIDPAIPFYEKAIALDPNSPEPCLDLSMLLVQQGQDRRAAELLTRGLAHAPRHPGLLNNLAWLLSTSPDVQVRNGTEALKLTERLRQVSPADDPAVLDTCAAAYAESGQYETAVRMAEQALKATTQPARADAAQSIRRRLELYRQARPYRRPGR